MVGKLCRRVDTVVTLYLPNHIQLPILPILKYI